MQHNVCKQTGSSKASNAEKIFFSKRSDSNWSPWIGSVVTGVVESVFRVVPCSGGREIATGTCSYSANMNTINQPTLNGKRHLSDKIMTLYFTQRLRVGHEFSGRVNRRIAWRRCRTFGYIRTKKFLGNLTNYSFQLLNEDPAPMSKVQYVNIHGFTK